MYDPWTGTKVGECWWEGGYRVKRSKGEKKWDNSNGIINEKYFKKLGGFGGRGRRKNQLIELEYS